MVLIADDNPLNLQILGNMLRDRGYRIALAQDGTKVFDFIDKRLPDLILLDIMMPEMDGIEICRKIKQSKKTKSIPVIFITGLTDTWNKLRAFEAGGVDYITKPFSKEEVIARVGVNIERKLAEEERLMLEAQVQQAKKYESLTVMAGSIAHRFNNYLYTVRGNLELADDELPDDSPVKTYIHEADQAALNAAELSMLMLTYVGKGGFTMIEMNMNEVALTLTEKLKFSVRPSTQIKTDIKPEPYMIKGDHDQLSRLITNLVINAEEAIDDEGGVIVLSSGTVVCDKDCFQPPFQEDDLPEGEYAYLEVTDSGCGMDQEVLNNIFDPFFTTKFTGRGLGLAAALGIMRAHRGAIVFQSEPGNGTKVRLLFPLKGLEAEEKEAMDISSKEKKNTILLVDDEEIVLDVGTTLLERIGYPVMTASNGAEAVEQYRQNGDHILCVLLDLSMPGMSGQETFKELERLDSDVKVIFTSGFSEREMAHQCKNIPAAGFLQKPFHLAGMSLKFEAVLKR
jgi:CheY-like chemotaxis protein